MEFSIQELAMTLKEARKSKTLSQRDLSKKTGIPQNHISQIERGLVDLQLSSFLEIARALELEPILIPRQLISVVRALLNHSQGPLPTPAYQLEEEIE